MLCNRSYGGCVKLPTPTTFTTVELTLSNFIGDCQVGNRSTNIDVPYVVTIKIRETTSSQNFDNAPRLWDTTFSSNNAADKKTIITNIQLPNNKGYWVDLSIDGKDCSLCVKGGCNAYQSVEGTGTFQVNNVAPIWGYRTTKTSIPSLNKLAITPLASTRFFNSTPICPCRIKI